MAEIVAPYTTASEINSQAGDPNLSGATVNFDPAIKAPFQPIQDTLNRVDVENFQRQEQLQRQKHDLLTKQMDYDQQNKILKQQQAWKDHQAMIDFFNSTDSTAFTLKGPNGQNMSISPLPADREQLNNETNAFHKQVMSDGWPDATNKQSFYDKNDELKQKRINASLRAMYAAMARQDLAGSYLPEQKQKVNDYLDYLNKTPLDAANPPQPYVSQPKWEAEPQVDVSKYKEKKDLESFDTGLGVPKRVYAAFETTQNPSLLNQGFGNYQNFLKTPQGQDPAAYQAYQDAFNKLRKKRGESLIDLGGSLASDGKLIFDDSTPNKRVDIARKFLTAYNEMQTGHLQNDPDAEENAKKLKKISAETDKDLAEAAIKWKEFKDGKVKAYTPEEKQILEASKNTIRRAWEVFNPEKYENKEGVPIESETKITKTHWFKPDEKEEVYKPIAGVDIGSVLKAEGMNPTDYKVFPTPAGIEEGVGKQRVGIGKNAQNQPTGKEFKTGENEKVDRAFTLYNPVTKEVKVAFFKNTPHTVDDETKMVPQLVNIVNGRDYVTHAPNAKYQWGIHGGKEVNNLNFETEQNQNLWDAIQQPGQQSTTQPPSNTKILNGVTYEQVNGKWYKVQ